VASELAKWGIKVITGLIDFLYIEEARHMTGELMNVKRGAVLCG
jgi:hypothetical protein